MPKGLAALLAALLLGACAPRGERTAEDLWAKYCARCHGDDGRGVPKQRARYPRVDLLAERYQESAGRDFVRRRIAAGRGPMPAFRRQLAPGEIEKLTDYVLRLDAQAGRAGQAGQGG